MLGNSAGWRDVFRLSRVLPGGSSAASVYEVFGGETLLRCAVPIDGAIRSECDICGVKILAPETAEPTLRVPFPGGCPCPAQRTDDVSKPLFTKVCFGVGGVEFRLCNLGANSR